MHQSSYQSGAILSMQFFAIPLLEAGGWRLERWDRDSSVQVAGLGEAEYNGGMPLNPYQPPGTEKSRDQWPANVCIVFAPMLLLIGVPLTIYLIAFGSLVDASLSWPESAAATFFRLVEPSNIALTLATFSYVAMGVVALCRVTLTDIPVSPVWAWATIVTAAWPVAAALAWFVWPAH